MSSKNASSSDSQDAKDRDPAELRAEKFRTSAQRETVEAFVVAFILALLFRAFLAEAFVIPTGSMAPTLMGAHKDLTCDRCGKTFPVGASLERRGPITEHAVVAGICPNCRKINSLDLGGDSNHATFNGDRILVSKFAYTVAEPQRWDVIVFKFPGNPKQNYIKRLVGLPQETLTVHHGDVFVRPTGSQQESVMLRKPAEKLLAMRHLVYDTDFQSDVLIESKYPSRWQPWMPDATEPPKDSWAITRSGDGFTAKLSEEDSKQLRWLRYFHRWPDETQWDRIDKGLSLADVDPYSSRLVTDFYAYDAYIHVDADYLYDEKPRAGGGSALSRLRNSGYSSGVLNPNYSSEEGIEQFSRRAEFGTQGLARDGIHWVGDLILESDIETSNDSRELVLEIVEAGIRYQCTVDLTNGVASLGIVGTDNEANDSELAFDKDDNDINLHPTADTGLRAGSRNEIRFSNCDDQLLLWVDDELVSFDAPTTYDSRSFLEDAEYRPRYAADVHPLDASPAALAVRGGEGTIHQLRIDRDKYYIATKDSSSGMFDYDMSKLWQLAGKSVTYFDIQKMMGQPETWDEFVGWQTRRSVSFELEEDQFFPMGDNSPESLDARCWAGTKLRFGMPEGADRWARADYVPRDLLVGKALLVFWPHSWNSPIPYTPNFRRMKLIR